MEAAEVLRDHEKSIATLTTAMVKIEMVLESDQEIKRDMKTSIEKLVIAMSNMTYMQKEIDELKEAKKKCSEEGCPKAQEAHRIAVRAWGYIIKGMVGVTSVVGLAIFAKVIKGD